MRRPLLYAVLLSVGLFVVLYGKYQLEQMIKDGKFGEPTPAPQANEMPNSIDIGVQQDPVREARNEAPPHSAGPNRTDIMASLVEARQSFRSKETTTSEVAANPHVTPNSILKAAEKLGELITLEQAHPEYAPEFQAFYLECSKDPAVITVTRVQCLEKFISSKKLSEADQQQLLAETDPLVKKLYLEMK